MTLDNFFSKYYFHDSGILKITLDSSRLTLVVDFCYWAQDWYCETEPENGVITVVFEGVEDYDGIVGEVDDFWILNFEMKENGVFILLEEGFDKPLYKIRFKAKSAWVEEIDAV